MLPNYRGLSHQLMSSEVRRNKHWRKMITSPFRQLWSKVVMGPKEVTKKVSSRLPTSKKGEAGGKEGDSEKDIDYSSLTIAQLKEKMRESGMASPTLKAR